MLQGNARAAYFIDPGGLAYTAKDDELRLLVPRFSAFQNAYSNAFKGYYTYDAVPISNIDAGHEAWRTADFCPTHPSPITRLT